MARVRLIWVWLIALTVAVMAAGCGDDDNPPPTEPDAAKTDVRTDTPASDVRTDGADVRVDTPPTDTPVPTQRSTRRLLRRTSRHGRRRAARRARRRRRDVPPPDADRRATRRAVLPTRTRPSRRLPTRTRRSLRRPTRRMPASARETTSAPTTSRTATRKPAHASRSTALAVSPTNPTNALGTKRQFQATITYSDNSTGPATGATWTSATTAVATIDAAGLASTLTVGTSVITATLGAVNGKTTLTVSAATLSSLAVTPSQPVDRARYDAAVYRDWHLLRHDDPGLDHAGHLDVGDAGGCHRRHGRRCSHGDRYRVERHHGELRRGMPVPR